MEETKNNNTDSEMPFCLLWDLERKEYARVESPWSDQDLKNMARFEVRARFKTEQEVVDALEKAKQDFIVAEIEPIGTIGIGIGIVGAGHFARTIMHRDTPSPVILADSHQVLPPLIGPSTNVQPFNGIINIDHDHFPTQPKITRGSNFTPKKKNRKK